MSQPCARHARRALLPRCARRGVVLAALGTGLWLGGQASASAEELSPAPMAGGTSSSAVQTVAAANVELLPPATSPADPTPDATASAVARAAEPASAVEAPVASEPMVSVVPAAAPAVHSVVLPVIDVADPIVEAAEPVLEATAPVQVVAAPVVAAVERAVPPVGDAASTLAGALDPVLASVADLLDPSMANALIATHEQPDVDAHGRDEVVQGSAARPAGAARARAPAADDVMTPVPGRAAVVPGPVRPHIPGTRGPAGAGGAGTSSFDQSPADVPAAVLTTITAALAATGEARDAAGDVASDPSFTPD